MEKRSLAVLFASILVVLCILLILGTQGVPPEPPNKSTSHESPVLKTARIRTVRCPSMRMGLISESSLYYESNGDLLFSTWVFGRKEATVGCKGPEYWFWVRSFDRHNLYLGERDGLARTPLRSVMRPEVISMLSWSYRIGPDDQLARLGGSCFASSRHGDIDLVVEFDSDKIRSQSVLKDGIKVATMEGDRYREFSGFLMPCKITITWHEEDVSEEFFVDEWIINGERMEIFKPEGLGEVSLENSSS